MENLYKLMELDKELVELYREYVEEHGFTQEAYEDTKKSFEEAFQMTCKRLDRVKSISDMDDISVQEEVACIEELLLNYRAEIESIGREEISPKLEG